MNIDKNNDYSPKLGGWNSLLVFTFLVVFPITEIINSYIQYTTTIELVNSVKGLKEYITVCIISSLILLVISVWCSLSFIRLKAYSVKLIKVFLILVFINGVLQESYTIISNLDVNYKLLIKEQISTNLKFSVFFSTVWFTYLIFSDRVENKFYNKDVDESIVKNKDLPNKNIAFNLKIYTYKFYNRLKSRLIIFNQSLSNLESDIIIITSLIIATVISVSLGFICGETKYYLYENGNRVDISLPPYTYNEFYFNYLISLPSFIVIGGLTFIYLKTKSKNEKNI
ncbi:DUF2569 family protein [uncultured Flavobacterium sp.]|uniref:DUF2569 family protein n=1 Tax=uncultured Flavobacterium sp. TaxID=165435 RepID=UPI0025938066|nr:DUF2569 family protein [uncultured Flavobacterium sp.]